VESVQFAGDNIGISGDTNLMVLTSGVLTVDGKVASTTLETSGAATVGTTLDVGGRPDAVENCGSADLAQREWVSVDIERRVRGGGVGAVCWRQHRHQRGHEPDGTDVGDVDG
jgi:hypothetical protein